MIDLTSIESRIRDEYNFIHAFIALHPYASVLLALLVGLGIGLTL